ncbi:SAM-dependent methyltransferase [Pigmentiphaga sp. NML080357]|uniref:class I SAM-dependent methyltransferase n=1 Tax=Pigmentiphaga sp. NML080357 TaxID=2008675 RepID=UPI000B421E12|nr:class I SAM-dependent methyltransferase [Pigmentiphaga sp. NML080357]OVZ61246.1 SAM-dependent methyltransferase [Pigmentiphaga sp. NML080357]
MMLALLGNSSQSNFFRQPAAAMAAAAFLALSGAVGAADRAASSYVPEVGQEGKDVVWVPTPQPLVEKMLDMAKATPRDYLIDLGSGDGRTVITAAKRGIRAHGIEYNPEMVELARRNASAAGVSQRATFANADLFDTDLSRASVITLFLLPTINEKLRPRLLELKPGTRVVSNTFPMGDWQPDEQATITQDCQGWCTALLWIVPAKVEGSWKLGGQELKLTQQYQRISGTLASTQIADASLRGDEISFTVNGVRYRGKVNGKTMQGTRSGAAPAAWTAVRN